jgi:hypothetical protein
MSEKTESEQLFESFCSRNQASCPAEPGPSMMLISTA